MFGCYCATLSQIKEFERDIHRAQMFSFFRAMYLEYLIRSPIFWICTALQIWMLIDAIRQKEWIWVLFILAFPGFGSLLYFFYIYRGSGSAMRGFELPGTHSRKRIKELQAQIHHLDKPHHHLELGDIYFQQGKLDQAEACYRAAMERDAADPDIRAHLGQCLLRQKKAAEALPLLATVVRVNPKHDYGHTLMALAEAMKSLGQSDQAISVLQQVTENHSYPRARVQLAELYIGAGLPDLAREQLQEVISDAPHTPAFQRRRDRIWFHRAKKLMSQLPKG